MHPLQTEACMIRAGALQIEASMHEMELYNLQHDIMQCMIVVYIIRIINNIISLNMHCVI